METQHTGNPNRRPESRRAGFFKGLADAFRSRPRGPMAENRAGAGALLGQVAAGRGLGACEMFRAERGVRDELLFEFCERARREGYRPSEAAWAIYRHRYPAKLAGYQTTSADQSAGEIVLAGTAKVNWFDLLEGGVPIVENRTLLNGTFGRKLTDRGLEAGRVWNEIADTLYLTKHDQHAGLPQSPWIMFAEKAREASQMDKAAERALRHRAQFKGELPGVVGNIVGDNHLKISDLNHADGTTKYRLLCVVFDCESGGLWVVSDKTGKGGTRRERQRFTDWAREPSNLCDILSCDGAELERIGRAARESGLMEKLSSPPRQADPGYRPWAELAERVRAGLREETGREEGWYRRANQIWRYALIARQVENVGRYGQKWRYIREVEATLTAVLKIACDDGRQAGDVKVLGALLTREEFGQLFGGRGTPEELVFAPHYKCGFLGAAFDIHMQFAHLRRVLRAELSGPEAGEFSRYRRSMEFFEGLLKAVRNRYGPVTERNILCDYLPPVLLEEFRDYVRESGAPGTESGAAGRNRQLVEFLYKVFIYNEETFREVIRRGERVGVFDASTGLLSMPAAELTEDRIQTYLDDGRRKSLTPNRVKSLVIEQVARYKFAQYRAWMEEMDAPVPIRAYLDNFETGQATRIPPKPESAGELLDFVREDFVLNDPSAYSPDEVARMGLNGRKTWTVPE